MDALNWALEYHTLILSFFKEPLCNKTVYFFLPGYLKAQLKEPPKHLISASSALPGRTASSRFSWPEASGEERRARVFASTSTHYFGGSLL